MVVAPKPSDPTRPSISPEELSRRIDELLSRPVDDPFAEAEQLEAAHRILSEALQNN